MTFTEKYFFEEVRRFREMFGDKTWWAKPEEMRDKCVDGLALVYLNIENEDGSRITDEQIKRWASIFEATTMEYERRKMMLLRFPPRVTSQLAA
jgi:hypothetical protein